MKKIKEIIPTRKKSSGGGHLENRTLGGIKKFTKNTKQKRILIGSIVGVILLIGGIYLYRTYALYEEKKEFNVLKGQVPDFSKWKYTYKVDGKVVAAKPTNNGEYQQTGITCSGVNNYSWDNTNWKVSYSTSNLTSKNVSCTIDFAKQAILANVVKLGDYINLSSHYSGSDTLRLYDDGCQSNIIIDKSSLNIWRVIAINNNTIDLVSELVNDSASFCGYKGFKKFSDVLSNLAAIFGINNYTTGTRYPTESDITTIKNVLGTAAAKNSAGVAQVYFIDKKYSRLFSTYCGGRHRDVYYVNTAGDTESAGLATTVDYPGNITPTGTQCSSFPKSYQVSKGIRPIITLNLDSIKCFGSGTSTNPYYELKK